jgi:DNA-binding GntR family transcriptional regulator
VNALITDSREVPEDPRIYVRVLFHVRGLVDSGRCSQGEPVPAIASLCQTFGCSRQTAAKALKLLSDDGILFRYPGLGYYVAPDYSPLGNF